MIKAGTSNKAMIVLQYYFKPSVSHIFLKTISEKVLTLMTQEKIEDVREWNEINDEQICKRQRVKSILSSYQRSLKIPSFDLL